jgi:hypothetical protein
MENTPEKKLHVSARVDQSAFNNCLSIAMDVDWSMTQIINFAMKKVTKEQIFEEMNKIKKPEGC